MSRSSLRTAAIVAFGVVLSSTLVSLAPGCHADGADSRSTVAPSAAPSPRPPVAAAITESKDDADAGAPPDEELCALTPTTTQVFASARSFVPSAAAECPMMCTSVEEPQDARDTCVVAASNLRRAERESRILSVAPSVPSRSSPAPVAAGTRPDYFDRIDAHLHLTDQEKAAFTRNGFVVLDRFAYSSYANAFHDVFQEQLPLYVSADAAMHAVFAGDELVLERVERKRLLPALHAMLTKMRAGLRAARPRLAPDTVQDLDVYLGVAFALATSDHYRTEEAHTNPLTFFGHDEEAANLVGLVESHTMTDTAVGIELFGRRRVVDFSQYEPRAHYADGSARSAPEEVPSLAPYFKALTWLSRLELNLVSRSCRSSQPGQVPDPTETPREAVDALALAEVARDSGAVAEIRRFDEVYRTFAGKREDVAVDDLLALEQTARFRATDAHAAGDLKAAIGEGFQRTARTHFMPGNVDQMPAIATLIGERIVADVGPLTTLVTDSVAGRTALGAADVGYVLGHDRARVYLKDDLARDPDLAAKLDAARAGLRTASNGHDVYSGWLRTVLAVAAPPPPEAVVPSFVRTEAYQDLRLDSALVGFGQLRHAFTLLAGQGYDEYGCEIPDGYVEPALTQWNALLDHVHQVQAVAGGFVGLERTLRMLRDIARTESTGAPLSEAQRRWLGMVSEYRDPGFQSDSGKPPTWTGWYYDMFEDRQLGATKNASFVADYFTLTNRGEVRYLGAETPRLGVFLVDVGGVPRAMVGPVAKGYETTSGLDERLDDAKARRRESADGTSHGAHVAPWRTSFAPSVSPVPRLGLRGHFFSCGGSEHAAGGVRLALRARLPLGKVTVTLLDHHGDALGPGTTVDLGPSWQSVSFELPAWSEGSPSPGEAVSLHVHDLSAAGLGAGAYDVSSRPSEFHSGAGEEYVDDADDPPVTPRPEPWKGAGDFRLGFGR